MSELDKFKKEFGYEYEGLWHEDVESLLQSGILNFCTCGSPDDNLLYVLGGLELIDEKRPDYSQSDEWYRGHKERALKHFGNERAEYFFYYWADKEGLTEHGGSVPGWLDEKGLNLLEMLREWKATATAPTTSKPE